jgi:uncharacterized protein (DUF433 family)
MLNDKFTIKGISVSVLDILDMISKGYDYETIIRKTPRLTLKDIKIAAKISHDYILMKMIKDKMKELNQNYEKLDERTQHSFKFKSIPQNLKMDESEEAELIRLYDSGADISDLARILNLPKDIIKIKIKELDLQKKGDK